MLLWNKHENNARNQTAATVNSYDRQILTVRSRVASSDVVELLNLRVPSMTRNVIASFYLYSLIRVDRVHTRNRLKPLLISLTREQSMHRVYGLHNIWKETRNEFAAAVEDECIDELILREEKNYLRRTGRLKRSS